MAYLAAVPWPSRWLLAWCRWCPCRGDESAVFLCSLPLLLMLLVQPLAGFSLPLSSVLGSCSVSCRSTGGNQYTYARPGRKKKEFQHQHEFCIFIFSYSISFFIIVLSFFLLFLVANDHGNDMNELLSEGSGPALYRLSIVWDLRPVTCNNTRISDKQVLSSTNYFLCSGDIPM
jgi:hypothetical protein